LLLPQGASLVNQGGETVFIEDVASHLLQVIGGEPVYMLHDVVEVAQFT